MTVTRPSPASQATDTTIASGGSEFNRVRPLEVCHNSREEVIVSTNTVVIVASAVDEACRQPRMLDAGFRGGLNRWFDPVADATDAGALDDNMLAGLSEDCGISWLG